MESLISDKAKIGANVKIGYGVRIYDNVEIADNCFIGDHSVIGWPTGGPNAGKKLYLGPNSLIRSHTVLYEGSSFKSRFETGHHAIVRDGVEAGHNFRLGNHSDVEGLNIIGDFTRAHGYVQIGRGSKIGSFVWLFSLTLYANDPIPPSHNATPVTIEDGVVICINATLFPGAHIGKAAFVSAGAIAKGNIPPCSVVTGSDSRIAGRVDLMVHAPTMTRHPWFNHFADAYPEDAQEGIMALRDFVKNYPKAKKST